jgi:glycosyltransferase involved in cell wall biosynthesis
MISIIIPVYNEEELIVKNTERLIGYLEKISENFEIITVDNGSTDRTVKLGKELEKKYPKKFKILSIPEKGYVGFAFRKGVRNSKYNKIISLDMDLSIELDFIKRCVNLLEKNSIVIGSKKVGEQNRQWYRVFASNVFIWMTKTILGLEYEDYSMGAKGFRKSDIEKYLDYIDKGSAYVYELTYWLEREGKNIVQIPTICKDNRKSKFNIIDESLYRFRNLITLCFFE